MLIDENDRHMQAIGGHGLSGHEGMDHLEGQTENICVCTKERKGVSAEVLMATPCTNSLGGESGGHRHEGGEGRSVCWKFAAVSLDLGPVPVHLLSTKVLNFVAVNEPKYCHKV